MNIAKKVAAPAAGALVGVLLAGGIAFGTAAANNEDGWPVNKAGQTYGTVANVQSAADEPDLIAARATNGKVGYVLASELSPLPKSVEHALELTEQSQRGYVIPVYESDGKTIVGEFTVGGTSAFTTDR